MKQGRQKLARQTVTEKREETYSGLECSWSLLSCAGCEPERRSRQMAWRAATSRANPCRATLGSATRASSPRDQLVSHAQHPEQGPEEGSGATSRTGPHRPHRSDIGGSDLADSVTTIQNSTTYHTTSKS